MRKNTGNPWDDVLSQRHGDKLKPATATVETASAPDEATIRERVASEVSERARDIAAACDIADKPERAADFIASGMSVSAVLAALNKEANPRGPRREHESLEDFRARRRAPVSPPRM